MTLADIADFREWHRAAVRRSLQAGYDLVYVYAGHGYTGLQHFLSPVLNQRTDEYGGSIANRMRLLRELLEDARELCDGKAAVACRLGVVETSMGITRAETEEVVGTLAELPDLWDFQAGAWEDDSATARFTGEAFQEEHVIGLKALTTKPVVGVGRFTSPDTMVDQIRRGVLDLIGAARPSIADPFLPEKIRTGRLEAIRECIGCNMCVSGDHTMSPIRCTQNPSMGEEWRRGWHPERLRPRASDARIAVVGAGPAGLEAATSLGRRGYDVTLLEASRELGGRVRREATLPGLATWIRVVDHRVHLLATQPHVDVYPQSEATVDDLLSAGFEQVVIATGSRWRADGVGRSSWTPITADSRATVLTPDDILDGVRPPSGSRVVLYDDDHYYLAGVLAELLAREGYAVELVTPAAVVSEWTVNTMESGRIRRRLMGLGVEIALERMLTAIDEGSATTACVHTGEPREHAADAVVLVTSRLPIDALHQELLARRSEWDAAGLRGAHLVGDGLSPGTIAAAVWSGRSVAERLEVDGPTPEHDFLREVTRLADLPA